MTVANIWESLLANLAILSLLVLSWVHFQHAISRWPKLARDVAFGVVMGAGAALAMQFTIELREGLYFDLRTVAVALAGVFAGPAGALVALTLASVQRTLMSGDGAIAGIMTMAAVATLSVAGNYLRRGRPASTSYVVIMGWSFHRSPPRVSFTELCCSGRNWLLRLP